MFSNSVREDVRQDLLNSDSCPSDSTGTGNVYNFGENTFDDFRSDVATQEDYIIANSPYYKRWVSMSGLKLLRPSAVKRSFESEGFLGLFLLFMRLSLFEAIHFWTVTMIRRRSYGAGFTTSVLYAYVGLEIATSLTKVPILSELWSNRMFFGTDDFGKVMSRDTFMRIRSSLRLYPSYDH